MFYAVKMVFVHGRAQEDKDPAVLREDWVSSLRAGLEAAELELPIKEEDILFPYYGDALRDVTGAEDADNAADVVLPQREQDFAAELISECLIGAGITEQSCADAEDGEEAPSDAKASKPNHPFAERFSSSLSKGWIQQGLRLLDTYVPRASAKSLALTAADVVQYLTDMDVQTYIEDGVAQAFDSCGKESTVVVGHSLGSIVAYRMLQEGGPIKCPVKALITIGSPLGIGAVRNDLDPIAFPPKVESWSNAYDEQDAIALNPLTMKYFPIEEEIRNYGGVHNPSDNHHKIRGYLSDPIVATWIVQALESCAT